MKKKNLLSKQSVTRKNPRKRSLFRDLLRFVISVSFKISILIVLMVSVSFIFLYAYRYLINSPYIKLKYIQVTGVDDGIKRELIKMSGLNDELSLLAINPNEIKRKMEKHSWIRTVELEKRFPHTLIIKAEKESPMALVVFDKLFYMNRGGRIFKELDQDDEIDYPVVTGISKGTEEADEKLRLAANILESFASERGFLSLSDISEIHVNDGEDVMIYMISVPAVIRMSGENLEEEKYRLKKLLKHLQDSGRIDTVSVIDMNYHDGAVVSYITTG